MQKVIDSSVEIFDQLREFIDSIDERTYQQNSPPLFDSSIGQHLRHILDIYQALMRNMDDRVVDYDIRLRGTPLETDRSAAIQTLETVRHWLAALTPSDIDRPLTISTEIAISEQHSALLQSSFARELFFASNHAIHHLALMVTLAKLLGCRIAQQYGVAPATASYLRKQDKEQERRACAH